MCNGKCYLKKQLDNTKQDRDENGFQLHEMPLFVQTKLVEKVVDNEFLILSDATHQKYQDSYIFLDISDIFHPPQTFV